MSEKKLASIIIQVETLPFDASQRCILDLIAEIKNLPIHSAAFAMERLALTLLERTQHDRL